jgi:hypothetical protein
MGGPGLGRDSDHAVNGASDRAGTPSQACIPPGARRAAVASGPGTGSLLVTQRGAATDHGPASQRRTAAPSRPPTWCWATARDCWPS